MAVKATQHELTQAPQRAMSSLPSRTLADAQGNGYKSLLCAVLVYRLFPDLHLPWLSLRGVPNENQTLASEGISCAFVARSLTEATVLLAVKPRLVAVEMRAVLLTRRFDLGWEANCR